MAEKQQSGFTLLEVLLAVLLFTIGITALVQTGTQFLQALTAARGEILESELGQRTLRDVAARIEQGEEIASESGRYEGDFEFVMRYDLSVEQYTVPIPESVELDPTIPVASVFTPVSVNADTPDTPLRRITVRVYREGRDPQLAEPLLAIVSLPVEAPAAQGNASSNEGPDNSDPTSQEEPGGADFAR